MAIRTELGQRRPRIRLGLVVVICVVSSVWSGCYIAHERDLPTAEVHEDPAPPRLPPRRSPVEEPDDAGDPSRDRQRTFEDAGPDDIRQRMCDNPAAVDLLLVLDDSGSFRPDDVVLRDRLERTLWRLVRPPDLDGNGEEDWARVGDLHVGIVSTSVRGSAFCDAVADGRLREGAGASFPTCHAGPYEAFQRYVEGDAPGRLIDDVSCVAFGPRDGCQVEQPLEAMAKALLTHDAPFSYVAGEARGDRENAGFLRTDSVLVVLIFTDEDDCSFLDPTIFDVPPVPDGAFLDAGVGAPGCRGALPEQMQPPSRYVDILRHVRPNLDHLVFAFVGGIGQPVATVFDDALGGCRTAFYPRRIVEVARGLDGHAIGGSMCALGESDFVQALAAQIGASACRDE